MINERRFILDIKIAAETNIDIDCSPDTTTEELQSVLNELRKLDFTKFKFKIVNNYYAEELAKYITDEVKKFGIIEKADFIKDKELMIAFTVKFDSKQ